MLRHIAFMRKADSRTHLICIVSILALGLLSIIWFRGNFIIKAGDSFFPVRLSSFLKEGASQIWAPKATGAPSPLTVLMYPFILQMMFLES
ncbi:hypothetical protein HKBW3S06_01602, partial [Candidatus Hakubella thermalkaliphila]